MQYLIYMCPREHKLLMCILWSINHKPTFRNRYPGPIMAIKGGLCLNMIQGILHGHVFFMNKHVPIPSSGHIHPHILLQSI